MQTYTHFRCVFDVSSAENLPNAWLALIGEISMWIRRKERTPVERWFFSSGSWTSSGSSRARVEVRSITDDGPTPAMWALRYEHLDSAISARRWITNIGVSQVKDREWRVAVQVLHGLRPDYVGKKLDEPKASSPKLVARLLESDRWVSRVGGQRLRGTPARLGVGEGNKFAELLQDPRRQVPIILISCDRRTNRPKLDAANLSADLAGTAVVYVCESPECDDELEHLIPYRFRSANGTVRIYAPGADFEQEWTSTRHRFLSAKQIDEEGVDFAAAQIVRALTRGDAWRGLQSSVCSIDDIDARVRERRLAELRSNDQRSLTEKEELLELFADENEKQQEKIRALEKKLQGKHELEFNLEKATASANEAKETVGHLRRAVQAVSELERWPESPHDLAGFAAGVFSDRLVMTPSALKSGLDARLHWEPASPAARPALSPLDNSRAFPGTSCGSRSGSPLWLPPSDLAAFGPGPSDR